MKMHFCAMDEGMSGCPTLTSESNMTGMGCVTIGYAEGETEPLFLYVYTEEDFENCGEPSILSNFKTFKNLEAALRIMGVEIEMTKDYFDFIASVPAKFLSNIGK
jgi:hypothetical protein